MEGDEEEGTLERVLMMRRRMKAARLVKERVFGEGGILRRGVVGDWGWLGGWWEGWEGWEEWVVGLGWGRDKRLKRNWGLEMEDLERRTGNWIL